MTTNRLATGLLSGLFLALAACGGEAGKTTPVCTPTCGANAACATVGVADVCVCLPGFSGDGQTCTASDASIPNDAGQDMGPGTPVDMGMPDAAMACSPTCDANASCSTAGGSPTCTCNAGFAGDGTTCTDVDECTLGTDTCASNATCTNTAGGFTCACATGYAGDGMVCTNVDECAAATNPCGSNATCTDTPGSFACTCVGGYVMGASGCVPDVDECTLGTDDCDANATCTNTADAFTCTCNNGFYGSGTTCMPGVCNPSADADTGSVTLTLTHLSLPVQDGFNLDGINNTSVVSGGVGTTVAGCNQVDWVGGIDNSIGVLAPSLGGVLDLSHAFQQTLLTSATGGGTTGNLTITITLDHLGTSANDPCVGVTLMATSTAGPSVSTSISASLVNNTLDARFAAPLVIPLDLNDQLPPASCSGGTCQPGYLMMTLLEPRIRLGLDAAHTAAQANSMLGGYFFGNDANAAYATANMTGLTTELQTFAATVGLGSSFTIQLITVFQGSRDLHMEPAGGLTPTGCTGSPSTSDRNSISVGLSFDSL